MTKVRCKGPGWAILMLLMLWGEVALAQTLSLSGKVLNIEGKPLPYSSISLNELEYGTVADERGYFEIELPAGEYQVDVNYLGYRRLRETLLLDRSMAKTFVLEEAPFFLDEQVIQADAREMGERLIRKVMENKDSLAVPFPLYQHKAYTKTALRFPEYFTFDSIVHYTLSPFRSKKAKAAGKKVQAPAWLPPELDSDILYLSENVSEVTLKGRKKSKERILHSRVSGDLTRFSFVGNLVTRFDPFSNRTRIPGVTERGLISPLADQAFMYYEYELKGYVGEGKNKTYKIAVIPKRRYDPVLTGFIYLADSSWAVKELDLWASSDQYLNILDSLWIHQEYLPIEEKWLPFRSTMTVTFSFDLVWVKVPMKARVVSLLYDYNTSPKVPPRFFNREVLVVESHTSEETRAYFDSIRPIPLTVMEARDYQFKDSLKQVREAIGYEDSIRKAQNKITLANVILLGQSFSGEGKWNSLNFEHLLSSVGFNPMEGWFVRPHLTFGWDLKNDASLQLDTRLRYAFTEEKFSYLLGLTWQTIPKRNEVLTLKGGDYISEFSRFSQIGFWPNTQGTLLYKNNYMKLYRKRFAEVGYGREIVNGVSFEANFRFENRREMPKLTDFSWFFRNESYEPNISLPPHKALLAELNLYIQPFNTYISSPNDKINLGSAFPLITVNLLHGFGNIEPDAPQFTRMSLSLSRNLRFGILGNSQWRITVGKFLNQEQVYFPEYFHLKANRTFSRPALYDGFFLIDYYEHSTTDPFLEAHFEHDFSGFLFNKIPFLRRLKIREFAGLHYFVRENQRPYLEGNFGVEKLFLKVLSVRFDLYFALINQGEYRRPSLKFLPPTILINLTK